MNLENKVHRTTRMIMETLMGVKNGENVVILTDTHQGPALAQSIADVVLEIGGEPLVVIKKPPDRANEELPKAVIESLKGSDVFVSIMSKTCGTMVQSVNTAMLEYGTRILHAAGLTPNTITDPAIADVDYEEMFRLSRKIFTMGGGREVRITSDSGCDFTAELLNYYELPAYAHDIGMWAVLPMIQASWVPSEGKANGTLVFDSFPHMFGSLSAPIKISVENSWVKSLEGGEEARMCEKVIMNSKNANFVGEIGLGFNPYSKRERTPPLSLFEATTVRGALTIGLGNAIGLGLPIASTVHLDGIAYEPTVEIDGKLIVSKGQLRVDA